MREQPLNPQTYFYTRKEKGLKHPCRSCNTHPPRSSPTNRPIAQLDLSVLRTEKEIIHTHSLSLSLSPLRAKSTKAPVRISLFHTLGVYVTRRKMGEGDRYDDDDDDDDDIQPEQM